MRKRVVAVVAVLVFLSAAVTFLFFPKIKTELAVKTWVDNVYPSERYCFGGKSIVVFYTTNVTYGERPVRDAVVSVLAYNINGSILGLNIPLNFTYDGQSGLWKTIIGYCAEPGSYYGEVFVRTTIDKELIEVSARTDQFSVE